MSDTQVMEIGVQALWLAVKLGAPVLIVALAIGLIVGLLQAVTQVQEVTLTFVPKFIGVVVVFVVAGNWMLSEIVSFTRALFDMVPALLG
ncbi:flagellar biosynthesis protein FliQ [Euzebya sp.]|uniref:flagellar biosynthesis protein FliQ n=1 Tax=Euzebya sp. TaxID=1971409 RepID=UPI003515B226